jgi:hypothetical protein
MADAPKYVSTAVDHDPFAEPAPRHVPVDSDPFPELKAMAALEQRVFSVELVIASAVAEIRSMLAALAQDVAQMHSAHDKLRDAYRAPKRIVRDEDGRPTGVVSDYSLH